MRFLPESDSASFRRSRAGSGGLRFAGAGVRLARCVLAAALLGVTACAAGTTPPATATAAPKAARALRFVLLASEDPRFGGPLHERVEAALRDAGYLLVAEDGDLELALAIESVAGVTPPDASSGGPAETVSVTLSASAGQRAGDLQRVSFTSRNGELDDDALVTLVQRLNASDRFRRLCAQTLQAIDEAAAHAEDDAAWREARDDDREAWRQANAEACKDPRSPGDCEGVQAYLDVVARRESRRGGHVREAKALLEASKAQVETLRKDEAYWSGESRAPECRADRTAEACAGVERYLQSFPSGMYEDEARRLLEASRAAPGGAATTVGRR